MPSVGDLAEHLPRNGGLEPTAPGTPQQGPTDTPPSAPHPLTVGVDFDTHALYLCAVYRAVQPRWAKAALRTKHTQGSIESILAVPAALTLAVHDLRDNDPAGLLACDLWIERGRGMSRKADWILGAVVGALIATWPRLSTGTPRMLNTSDWKKHVGAPGNCAKPVANTLTTLHLRALHPGLTIPSDHNMLDAYAIAATGAER